MQVFSSEALMSRERILWLWCICFNQRSRSCQMWNGVQLHPQFCMTNRVRLWCTKVTLYTNKYSTSWKRIWYKIWTRNKLNWIGKLMMDWFYGRSAKWGLGFKKSNQNHYKIVLSSQFVINPLTLFCIISCPLVAWSYLSKLVLGRVWVTGRSASVIIAYQLL